MMTKYSMLQYVHLPQQGIFIFPGVENLAEWN